MSDELVWPDESDDKIPKRPWWAPFERCVVPLGMIMVLGGISLVFSALSGGQMRTELNAAHARREAKLPAGYYGETRETPSGVRDVEIGIVFTVVPFGGRTIVEVVVDDGRSRPISDWVIARETLQVGDKCLMKWVDGVNCRERGAFKIHDRQ